MDRQSERFEFAVRQRGCVASRILRNGAAGRVSATFDASFYVEMEEGLACIGNAGLGSGPLNLITTAPEGTNWVSSGLRLNAKINISEDVMRVGERFTFPLRDAVEWRPDPPSLTWGVETSRHGLAAFREASAGRIPLVGLGRFIQTEAGPFNEQFASGIAKSSIRGLRNWLVSSFRVPEGGTAEVRQWIEPLIGMGPGLTPSGDDFLAGMMVALHSLGESKISRRLWTPIRQFAIEAGNPVSLAHLDAASEGLASAEIHRALAAIMDGRPEAVRNTLASIDGIGHTSGWDAMAGVVTTLDAWLSAHATGRAKRG